MLSVRKLNVKDNEGLKWAYEVLTKVIVIFFLQDMIFLAAYKNEIFLTTRFFKYILLVPIKNDVLPLPSLKLGQLKASFKNKDIFFVLIFELTFFIK